RFRMAPVRNILCVFGEYESPRLPETCTFVRTRSHPPRTSCEHRIVDASVHGLHEIPLIFARERRFLLSAFGRPEPTNHTPLLVSFREHTQVCASDFFFLLR